MLVIATFSMMMAFVQLVAAQQTSLRIPVFNPRRSVSVDVIGTDSQSGWTVQSPANSTLAVGGRVPGIGALMGGSNYTSVGCAATLDAKTLKPRDSTVGLCSSSRIGTPIPTIQTTITSLLVLIGASTPLSPAPMNPALPSAASGTSTSNSTTPKPTNINGILSGRVCLTSSMGLCVYLLMAFVGNVLG